MGARYSGGAAAADLVAARCRSTVERAIDFSAHLDSKTLMVEPGQEIRGSYRILINSQTEGPHGSTLLPKYENAWRYMAREGEMEAPVKTETLPQPPANPGH